MIAGAPAGQPARVSVRLDVEMLPNLNTALVWGTLPGASDETIYVIAHRDGWFDAGSDNASGVATMIGLAEHYAKLPQAQRRRTLVTQPFRGSGGSRLGGAAVTFEPRARTHWHAHPLGQLLVVTTGRGWVQIEGGQCVPSVPVV